MLGKVKRVEPKLFYSGLSLEDRIPPNHLLRRIRERIDWRFVREEVAPLYGRCGHESIDPVVLIKLMLVLFLEQVRSERALMEQMPYRLDWLWFCGYDLDEDVPHHSVLSKARRRWGPDVFVKLFQRVLAQCVEAGLVDGRLVHVDGSVIRADAALDSLQPDLRVLSEGLYAELERSSEAETAGKPATAGGSDAGGRQKVLGRPDVAGDRDTGGMPEAAGKQDVAGGGGIAKDAEDAGEPGAAPPAGLSAQTSDGRASNAKTSDAPVADAQVGRMISSTDPDARLTRKSGRTVLGYKEHRVVDDACGIVTATVTTDAAVDESHVLTDVLDQHRANSGCVEETVVADRGYGTRAVYKELYERGTRPCIPHQRHGGTHGTFASERFRYDAEADEYICPAGHRLRRKPARRRRRSDTPVRYYADPATCQSCPLRTRCTKNAQGRTVIRDPDQWYVEWADGCRPASQRRRLQGRRRVRSEGSFADAANNHGFKRARWRRLWRVEIQNLLIATAQNLRKLTRAWGAKPARAAAAFHARSAFIAVVCSRALHQTGQFILPVVRNIIHHRFRPLPQTLISPGAS